VYTSTCLSVICQPAARRVPTFQLRNNMESGWLDFCFFSI